MITKKFPFDIRVLIGEYFCKHFDPIVIIINIEAISFKHFCVLGEFSFSILYIDLAVLSYRLIDFEFCKYRNMAIRNTCKNINEKWH